MDVQPQADKIQLAQHKSLTHRERSEHRQDVAERFIYFLGGILLSTLAIRFVFALLGANANNGIAVFIYGITAPFVAPFANLFNYNFTVGVVSFESYTLVAIAIYGLLCYGCAKLVTLNRHY
jgi:uncharacterized protein YggT (Ycf19 family)